MDREYFKVDPKKINKEDRRFLLSKNSQEILFNQQGIWHNQAFLISIFALFSSLIVLIWGFREIINNYLAITLIAIIGISMIYLLIAFSNSLRKIKRQQSVMQTSYDSLFGLHFSYAKEKNV